MGWAIGMLAVLALFPGALAITEEYTSTSTWTAPFGVTEVVVEVWGAGGGGGNMTLTNNGAGGGGGGAYSRSTLKVMPGAVYTVTVGAGGVGGNAGGDSWFNSTTTILAKGGSGGVVNSGAGASGGLASSGVGDIKYGGGAGGNGSTADAGGGGGGGAGTTEDGSVGGNGSGTTPGSGGEGGSSHGGSGGAGGNTNTNGNPGTSIGGGGGGATSTRGSTVGGAGANGQVRISHNYVPFKVHRNTTTLLSYINQTTVPISIKDASQAFVLLTRSSAGNEPSMLHVLGEIVNTTLLNFSIYGSTGSTVNISWEVIEDTKLSVQRGKKMANTENLAVYITTNETNLNTSFIIVSTRHNSTSLDHLNRGMWSGRFVDGLTNLNDTDTGNWLGANNILAVDTDGQDNIYMSGSNGKFGVYNQTDGILYDLSATDTGDWVGSSSLIALTVSANGLVYVSSSNGKFGVYNQSTNTLTDLGSVDTGDWISGTSINGLASFGTELIYLGLSSGKFGVYNSTSNVATDLSATDPSNWLSTSSILSIATDSTGLAYITGGSGIFGVYNASDNILYDYRAKDTGNWISTDILNAVSVGPDDLAYVGGQNGKFGVYNKTADTLTDLSATDTDNWIGTTLFFSINAEAQNAVYLGLSSGRFGVYNQTGGVATSLNMTGPDDWLRQDINSMTATSNGDVYLGLDGGDFGAYGIDGRTIVLERSLSGNVTEIAWQVVEWAGSQVQSGSTTHDTTSNNVFTALANPVDTSASFLILSTRTNASVGLRTMVLGRIENSTHVNLSRQQAADGAFSEWFLVENTRFTVTSATKNFTTTTPVGDFVSVENSSRTFGVMSFSSTGGGTNNANTFFTMRLDNLSVSSINITFVKRTATQTQTAQYFVVDVKDMVDECTPTGDQDWYFDGRQECTFGNTTVRIDKTEAGLDMICTGPGSVNFFGTRVRDAQTIEARDSCTINAYGGATVGVQE